MAHPSSNSSGTNRSVSKSFTEAPSKRHNIRDMIYVWWWRNLARLGIGDPLNILVYHKPKARHK